MSMTPADRKKKLNEIRHRTRIIGSPVDFLLTELDLRDEALKHTLKWIDGSNIFCKAELVRIIREALGEE